MKRPSHDCNLGGERGTSLVWTRLNALYRINVPEKNDQKYVVLVVTRTLLGAPGIQMFVMVRNLGVPQIPTHKDKNSKNYIL